MDSERMCVMFGPSNRIQKSLNVTESKESGGCADFSKLALIQHAVEHAWESTELGKTFSICFQFTAG